jgi:ophiobolin F synthase
MVEYGMAFRVSEHDRELVKDIFESIEKGLMLTNDYWSWDREYRDWKEKGNRLVNAIDVIRRIHALSIHEAKEAVKTLIGTKEQEYVTQKTEFYEKHPDISQNLRRWIEAAGCFLSGNHYWATGCPRHHAKPQEQLSSNASNSSTCDLSAYSSTCSASPRRLGSDSSKCMVAELRGQY